MTETNRLRVLEEYKVLDTLPEREFDDIVELASAICNTPISLITLIDTDRQWFKAKKGIEINETKREYAFCHYAIKQPDDVMVVTRSREDKRFENNPFVTGKPNLQFYAGAPLVTPCGQSLGTLCVIDDKPRTFNNEQKRLLKVLADRVIKLLELRKENLQHRSQLEGMQGKLEITLTRLLEAQHTARIGSWEWNVKTGEHYWSPEMYNLFGMDSKKNQQITFEKWQSHIHPEDLPIVMESIDQGFKSHTLRTLEYRVKKVSGQEVWLLGKGKVTINDKGEVIRISGTSLDITERKKAETERQQYLKILEEMLFGLSHKIRSPVASCLGLISSLETDKLSEEQMKEYASYFKASAQELDRFIQEMTNFIYDSKLKIIGQT